MKLINTNMDISIWLIALLLLSSSVAASDILMPKIVAGTLAGYAPFTFFIENEGDLPSNKISNKETLTGFSWEVVKAAYQASGYEIDLRVYPWARAVQLLESGRIDILFPTGWNQIRATKYRYSNNPINSVTFVLYSPVKNNFKFSHLADLKDETIAYIRGYNLGNKWEESSNFVKYEVNSIDQGLNMALLGRVLAFAGYDLPTDHFLHSKKRKHLFVKSPSFGNSNEYVVTLNNHELSIEILSAFDKGYQLILENGELEKIKMKWFGTP